jgi:hypothetical protein
MKKVQYGWIIILAITMVAASCKKEDKSSATAAVSTNLKSGASWRVSWYYDSDKEETSNFSSYTFEFSDNGVFTAFASSGNTSGSWSYDDSSKKLNISIGSSSPLSDLTDDWLITEHSDSVIKLKDDNSEKQEELHFALI